MKNRWPLIVLFFLPFLVEAAAPQYRYRSQSIPAAGPEEPIRKEFSGKLLQKHVDQAASLWAKQKQCISCHTHGIYLYVRPQLSNIGANRTRRSAGSSSAR